MKHRLLKIVGFLIVVIMITGCSTHKSGVTQYLSGHGSFDLLAEQVMPVLEDFPDSSEFQVEYDKRSNPIDRFECYFLRITFSEYEYAQYLEKLQSEQGAGEENSPNFYMLPKDEHGKPCVFWRDTYSFDPAYAVELPQVHHANAIRLIGTDDTNCQIIYLFFSMDSGSSMTLDLLLSTDYFDRFCWT